VTTGAAGFRRSRRFHFFTIVVAIALALPLLAQQPYPFASTRSAADTLVQRIAPPAGFVREPAAPESFAAWLRRLPLKPGRPEVRLFDGRLKPSPRSMR
jgi:hypothetical protein